MYVISTIIGNVNIIMTLPVCPFGRSVWGDDKKTGSFW